VLLLSHFVPALYFTNMALFTIGSLGSFVGLYPYQDFQEQFTMLSVSLAYFSSLENIRKFPTSQNRRLQLNRKYLA
jgi:hypothetical protein